MAVKPSLGPLELVVVVHPGGHDMTVWGHNFPLRFPYIYISLFHTKFVRIENHLIHNSQFQNITVTACVTLCYNYTITKFNKSDFRFKISIIKHYQTQTKCNMYDFIY